jgi:hypothetical protein
MYITLFSLIDKSFLLFKRYDFLFDDDDESHGSYLTDEDELHFGNEHELSDNDDDEDDDLPQLWN